jgi:tape measure domain-containing protein
MATDLERLVVQLSADVKGYQNALNRAQGLTNRQARAIESRFKKMNSNISSSFQNTLSSSVAAIGGALGVAEITRYADAWTEAGNKINAAAQSAGVQARSLEDLTKGANDARASLTDYADLYARLIRSASGVAKNEQEIATATNTVAKAFKAGGAAVQEQAAGILQLGQALGSGVLQGDELRSLRENAPVIADAIAKEFGVTIAGLKKLGSEGKLTSDRVFKAILNAQAPIEAQFAKTNATISDSFTKLKNNLTQYIGQTSEAYGITQTIGQIMGALAGNISSVANAAAAAGAVLLATFGRGAAFASIAALANPFVALAAAVGAAAFAVTQLWDEIVPLQGSFATLGDYANAMWQMLSAGAESAKASITSAFDQVLSTINGVLEGTGVSFSGLGDIVKFFVNNTIENFVRMKDIIVATFTIVPSAIGEAVVGAMNAMIAGVEAGINRVISAVNSAVASINSLSEYAGVSPIGQVGPIDLDRIVNEYEGAGKKAAVAFNDAVTREAKDYVGAAGDAITSTVDKAVGAVTAKANEIARARRELIKDAGLGGPVESGVTNTTGFGGGIGGAGDGSSGGSGKKGRGSKQNDYQREIEQIQKRTAALQAETLAQSAINPLINDYGYAVEYAAAKHDLLTAAQEAGLAITPELEANIDKLAMAYGNAVVESERLAESQDKLKQAADDFKSSAKDITSGFISDIRGGATAAEALSNALGKVLDKVIDIGLNSIFGLGGGGGGGLFGGLLKVFGLKDGGIVHAATGGRIQGPGTGRSDSIPAMLSNGEFVVNAAATKKYAGLLEAINGGKAIRLANGGYANPSAPTLPTMNKSSFAGSSKDVVTVILQDDSGRMASIADQQIKTASGAIVKVAVTQANKSAPAAMAQYQQKTAGGDYRN